MGFNPLNNHNKPHRKYFLSIMKIKSGMLLMLALAFGACSQPGRVKVNVSNVSDHDCSQATVELSKDSVLNRLGSAYCYVTDAEGNEIPSQITYDGKLIFQTSLPAGGSAEYVVLPSDTVHSYDNLTSGRLYPERADDMAWENEVNGYRVYGPATQAKGERGFGYDIFFKHATPEQILEKLYGPETDPATWQKADSLRQIDPKLADEFINSISYHIDHGLGMDCYAVGPTLGAGVAAIVNNDTIRYPWCYEKAEILDNGPLRFTARLDFAPTVIGNDSAVVEHRLISLDAGSYLNNTEVWYDGLSEPAEVAMGFPLRDNSAAFFKENILAYSDPTQGPDNGRALLGLVSRKQLGHRSDLDNHVVGVLPIQPSDTVSYSWGFAWDRESIKDMDSWAAYLQNYTTTPVRVEY